VDAKIRVDVYQWRILCQPRAWPAIQQWVTLSGLMPCRVEHDALDVNLVQASPQLGNGPTTQDDVGVHHNLHAGRTGASASVPKQAAIREVAQCDVGINRQLPTQSIVGKLVYVRQDRHIDVQVNQLHHGLL